MSLLCLDVGGSSIKYALCSNSGELSSGGKVPTPFDSFADFCSTVQSLVLGFADAHPEGVAISLPGRIDSSRGYCYSGGYLNYNARRAVGPELEQLLGLKVTLENDAKAAARAELWCGALQGVQSGAVLVLGTGLGGGIITNGRLHAGPTGASGELSFMLSDITEPISSHTIAANVISSTGLLVLAAEAYHLPYSLDVRKGYSLPMDGVEFFRRVEAGESEALSALDRFGELTGRFIVNLAAVLDVQKVALGGGISAQPALIEACRDGVHRIFASFPLPREMVAIAEPEVLPCRFHNDANLLGAAHCFAEYTGWQLQS